MYVCVLANLPPSLSTAWRNPPPLQTAVDVPSSGWRHLLDTLGKFSFFWLTANLLDFFGCLESRQCWRPLLAGGDQM